MEMHFSRAILVCAILVVVIFLIAPILLPRREKPEPKVQIEMRSLLGALQYYQAEYGKYPSGNSAGILQALLGNNPKMQPFLVVPARSTNSTGQFIDPWGTPYEIVLESANHVTIRSAGENKTFGDKDDVTMKTSGR
jgi:hypothetical protein